MGIARQELKNIALEVIDTVDAANMMGIDYEDIGDIISELLEEKFELTILAEEVDWGVPEGLTDEEDSDIIII